MMVLRTALGVCVVCGLAILIFPSPGCLPPEEDPVPCDPQLGVCPPPEPGIVLDKVGLTKSVWFEEERVGPPDQLQPTLCRADLDIHAGEELVFRGDDGFAVLTVDSGQGVLQVVVAPEEFSSVRFLDVDRDGNFEYLTSDEPGGQRALLDHVGNPLWREPDDIDLHRWSFEFADVNSDGTLEFGGRTEDEIVVFDATGTVLYRIPGTSFSDLHFGDFDGDGMLEVVQVVTKDFDEMVETWRLDGTLLGSFESPVDYPRLVVDRLPDDESRDYVRIQCTLFDIDGTEVGQIDAGPEGFCGLDGVDYGEAFETLGTCASEGEAETLHVRFAADREPFRVEPTYSIDSIGTTFVCGFSLDIHATRTILRVYDPDDILVYHEVIVSASAPGSITVIPSDVEGEEILLVADGTRILAYRIGHKPEEG